MLTEPRDYSDLLHVTLHAAFMIEHLPLLTQVGSSTIKNECTLIPMPVVRAIGKALMPIHYNSPPPYIIGISACAPHLFD